MKQCSKCKLSKPYDKFNKGTNGGYASYCRECQKEYYLQRSEGRNRHQKGKTRTCKICKVEKPISSFRRMGRSKYRHSYCRDCATHHAHARMVKNKYGISADDYAQMLYNQGNVCAICKQSDTKRLSVDHDHACCSGDTSCGKCIRGLLCSRCNRTLGMVKDDVSILKNMIEYLS